MSEAAKAEFERHCGPDCKFVSCEPFDRGRRTEVVYEVPALGRHFIFGCHTSDVLRAANLSGIAAKANAALKIAEAAKAK